MPGFIDKNKKTQPDLSEVGFADSVMYSGKDFAKYNEDCLLRNRGANVYSKMMNDDQVKPSMQFKQHAVISRDFYFDIDEENEQHKEMADFFNHMFKQIKGSFKDKLIFILSGLENGFSVVEKIYSTEINYKDKVYWGIKDLKLRPFDTFTFIVDNHGNIEKIKQMAGSSEIDMPISKVLMFVHQPDVDPIFGLSDLRAAYKAYWHKDIAMKFQGIHLERHASGFYLAMTKGSLTAPERSKLMSFFRNLSVRQGGYMSTNTVEKVEQFNPMRTDAYDRAIVQHNVAISRSLLVPNLMGLSEQGKNGSRALGDTQLEGFYWVLDLISGRLADTINEEILKEIAVWNWGTDDYPLFTFQPMSDSQKEKVATTWGELISKGAVTKDEGSEAWVRDLMGAPEKVEDEEPTDDLFNPDEIEEPKEPSQEEWLDEKEKEQKGFKSFALKQFESKQWLRRVNFAKTETLMNEEEESFENAVLPYYAAISVSIEKQVIKIVGEKSMGNLKYSVAGDVKVPKSALTGIRKESRKELESTVQKEVVLAKKELPKMPKTFAVTGVGSSTSHIHDFLSSASMRIAGVTEATVLEAVSQEITNGIKYDKTLKQLLESMRENTKLVSMLPAVDLAGRAINVPARLTNIARTSTSDAVNQARMGFFGQPEMKGFVVSYEFSAILDGVVTPTCEANDGKIRKDWSDRTPPNHFQCRSILVPVTAIDDWSGKQDNLTIAGIPNKGFS